ncbi:MAG: hypothetical protein PVF95_13860 [bacterium]
MKTRLTACILMCAVVALLASSVAFGLKPAAAKIPNGPAGNSHVGHLYLFEKDPVSWEIVDGGARGKMKYNLEGYEFDFVFNGHGLEPGMDYTLIYYPDPWPGDGLICLGEGTSDFDGNVHIKNSVDTGSLPAMGDENYMDGAKIWLVFTNDVDCMMRSMIGWNPIEYLFEYDLITFEDIDG